MNFATLLAQASQPSTPMQWWENPQSLFFGLILGVLVIMIFSSSRNKKKEQRQRDDMLTGMKRGDRVLTIGGILGTLVEVRDTEVVLKVDETTNSKIKFTRDAIKTVMGDEEGAK